MTIKERLKFFVKYTKMSERHFCITLNLSPGYINSMSKSIQPDKLNSISARFPELNIGWLMTGEGEMLKNESQNGITGNGNVHIGGYSRGKISVNDTILVGNNNGGSIRINSKNSHLKPSNETELTECILCQEKEKLIQNLERQLQTNAELLKAKDAIISEKERLITILLK